MVKLSKKYPVHLGAAYKSINMEREAIAILEEAHLSKDFFRLKCSYSSWIFECNYATFCYYWKIIEE